MMKRVDLYFLLLATLMMCAGVMMGMHMAMTQDFTLRPVHAHANLVGWASLAIFGLTYRAYPVLKDGLVAKLHFGAAAISAILMPFGIYRAVTAMDESLAGPASMLWAVAVLLFLVQLVKLLRAQDA